MLNNGTRKVPRTRLLELHAVIANHKAVMPKLFDDGRQSLYCPQRECVSAVFGLAEKTQT
jgi:hypothetical protein